MTVTVAVALAYLGFNIGFSGALLSILFLMEGVEVEDIKEALKRALEDE